MASAETAVAKKLVGVLLDLFPLPSIARKAVDIPIGYLFDRIGADHKKTISVVAAQIAADLARYPDHENPGSAKSASNDVVDILRISGLGAKQLVELDLDEEKVLFFLLGAAGPFLKGASQLRQGFIRTGLEQIARAVVEAGPELPGVHLAFMQAMLGSRHDRAA